MDVGHNLKTRETGKIIINHINKKHEENRL